jgi:FkbM family methyltransferase
MKQYTRIFYDEGWIHQHHDGVIVEPRIQLARTISSLAASTKHSCFRHYTPQSGDSIVVVGAGVGHQLITFSKHVGPTGRVVAIEAHPTTFRCLQQMCAYNHLHNVTLLHRAILDRDVEVYIEDRSNYQVNRVVPEKTGISVTATTLDKVLDELKIHQIHFLLMNIEGAEKVAIKGMRKTIAKTHSLLIACHDFVAQREQNPAMKTKHVVTQFLVNHHFRIDSRVQDPRDWVRDLIYGVSAAQTA